LVVTYLYIVTSVFRS